MPEADHHQQEQKEQREHQKGHVTDELKAVYIRVHGIGCLLQHVGHGHQPESGAGDSDSDVCWFGVGAILMDLAGRLETSWKALESKETLA